MKKTQEKEPRESEVAGARSAQWQAIPVQSAQRRPVNIPDSDIEASAKWREIFGLEGKRPLMLTDVLDRIHPDDQAKPVGSHFLSGRLVTKLPKIGRAIRCAAEKGPSDRTEGGILLAEERMR